MGRREALVERFRGVAAERLDRLEAHVLAGLRDGLSAEALGALRREAHTLKGEARMVGFRRLSELVHGMEDAVESSALRRMLDGVDLGRRLLDGAVEPSASLETEVARWLEGSDEADAWADVTPTEEAPLVPRRAGDADLRVAAADLTELAEQVARLRQGLRRHQQVVGELLDTLASARRPDPDPALASAERAGRQLHRLGSEQAGLLETVAEGLRHLRFRHLDEVFATLPRLAHDVARARGKAVEVHCRGGDIGIDENVLAALREPLMHLVKNAVDHGLEAPEARRAVGKSPVGRVEVVARSVGDQVWIDVEDDGGGFDLERVGARAVARQLINAEERERLSVDQRLELMFHPGLSTREEADAWSGRGVGLSAVREAMHELGGHVVAERAAIGARFRLDVPLTTFATRVQVARVGPHRVAVPARHLLAVRHLAPDDIVTTARGQRFEHEGHLVALADFGQVLRAGRILPVAQLPVLIVEAGARIGLAVSEVLSTQSVVVQPPGRFLRGVGVVGGFAVVDPGHVALVPSVDRLVREALQQRRSRTGTERARRRILLVDDSAFTRAMLARLLRDMGHEVLEAADGAEGLDRIRTDAPELVFTDLDMPGMDGFTLLTALREEGLDVPVGVISTHREPTVQARARALGARSYLVKASFHDDELAQAILDLAPS